MSRALDDVLGRPLAVCVGPGGVGKTTCAAALGLRAARAGRRVLVLTIDPARRLAGALGLDGLSDGITQVPSEPLLEAAMLDTKASFDALMGRLTEGAVLQRILDNRVYRAFSRTLARSHAYVAAERLHDVMASKVYDLVILDTPPTRSALEILDAPHRLTQFLADDVLRFFLRSEGVTEESVLGGTLAQLVGLGGRAATKILGRLAGDEVVRELAEFLSILASQRDGFMARATRTAELLSDPRTAYVLVASTSPAALADAEALANALSARGPVPALLVFNRAYQVEPGMKTPLIAQRPTAASAPATMKAEVFDRALQELRVLRATVAARQHEGFERAGAFRDRMDPDIPALAVAEVDGDIRTLEALGALFDASIPL